MGFWDSAWNCVVSVVEGVVETVGNVVEEVVETVKVLAEAVVDTFNKAIEAAAKAIEAAVRVVVKVVLTFMLPSITGLKKSCAKCDRPLRELCLLCDPSGATCCNPDHCPHSDEDRKGPNGGGGGGGINLTLEDQFMSPDELAELIRRKLPAHMADEILRNRRKKRFCAVCGQLLRKLCLVCDPTGATCWDPAHCPHSPRASPPPALKFCTECGQTLRKVCMLCDPSGATCCNPEHCPHAPSTSGR